MGKLIIFSAPSGSGKSTIINYLLTQNLNLAFSISATSRPPRGTERDGVEYFFLSPEEFRRRIAEAISRSFMATVPCLSLSSRLRSKSCASAWWGEVLIRPKSSRIVWPRLPTKCLLPRSSTRLL